MHGITSQVLLRSIVEISVNMNQCQYYGISHYSTVSVKVTYSS